MALDPLVVQARLEAVVSQPVVKQHPTKPQGLGCEAIHEFKARLHEQIISI